MINLITLLQTSQDGNGIFYRWLIKTEQYTLQETWYVALAVVVSSIVLAWLCLKIYDEPVRKRLAKVWQQ